VTGRHSNQLNYRSLSLFWDGKDRVFCLLYEKLFFGNFLKWTECVLPIPAFFNCIFGAQSNFMSDQQNVNPNQLNIEITEEVAEGEYANLAIITHSHAEFVIDFVNVMPGTPKSKVKSRIIFTPQHAKRFMKALTENVQRFEQANGNIRDLEEMQIPLNFGGPTAQA
jgi:ribonuclease BN (tRNA processing enzyme)